MKYDNIKVGSVYSFQRKISQKDVMDFAHFTGDFNPLHVDRTFGEKSIFKRNIAHGMLTASLFSTLIGMHCPGETSLYLSQSLHFKRPLFFGDSVTVKGTVTHKNDSVKVIAIKMEILKGDEIITSGEAKVKVLDEQ